jgi:hypothetical protein
VTSVPYTVYVERGATAPDFTLRLRAAAPAAGTGRATGPVLLELTALELAVHLQDGQAESADGVRDAVLRADLVDGGGGQRLEALDHDPVRALLRVVVVVLGVELEPGPLGAGARCGGGLGHRHVRAEAVQRFQDLVLGLAHAGGDRTDDDDQRNTEGEPRGDDQRRLSAAAQLAPEIGEEHGARL